jgi:intracellular septation protein A
MTKLKILSSFLFSNFGPLIIFYFCNHFWGLKVALAATVIWTIGEIIFKKLKGKELSQFFIFTATITIVFGLIDIYLQQSIFFKFEAPLTNFVVGLYFALSLFGKPLIQEFAEQQGRIAGTLSADTEYYFKFLTLVWAFYMWAKSVVYIWVAMNMTLEEGLVFRTIFGSISFYGLLGISIFGAPMIKPLLARAKFLPSSRIS